MQILFLQKPALLKSQRTLVANTLAELEGVEVRFAGSSQDAHRSPNASIVIAPTLPWLADALNGLPNVRWIHFLSAGVDRIWEMPFDKMRYAMSKSTGVHAATVAEYVLGAMLFALKGFGTFRDRMRRQEWKPFWLEELHGKTLGIVGIGSVGVRLARYGKMLGMRVIGSVAHPRRIPDVDAVFAPEELGRVLSASDFLVLLVPLTDATRRLIGAAEFRATKRGAWLINVARGEVVDEAALVQALQRRLIGGAVLDVFKDEPLPASSPLWKMENVLVTPHVAGTTQHYMPHALDIFKKNYRRFIGTGELSTPVSAVTGY